MDWKKIRLKQIEDNLRQDHELLKEYETCLRLTDDPRERVKCQMCPLSA